MKTTHIFLFLIVVVLVDCNRNKDAAEIKNHSFSAGSAEDIQVQEAVSFFCNATEFCTDPCVQKPDIHGKLICLLTNADAEKIFDSMLQSENWVTVLYGLVGAYYTRPTDYCQMVENAYKRAGDADVAVTDYGDVKFPARERVRDILKREDACVLYYGENLISNRWRTGVQRPVDFAGGGYPVFLMDVASADRIERGLCPPNPGGDSADRIPGPERIETINIEWFRRDVEFYDMWRKNLEHAYKSSP